MKKLVIVGASGHGKVVADIAVNNGYDEIVFLDDAEDKIDCAGFKVVGKTSDAQKYMDCEFVVAIGNAKVRERIQNELEDKGCTVATLIHPAATISRRVNIGRGTVVMAGAVINSDSVIGKGCIINTSATLDHDNVIEDYAHVSVGAHLAGNVTVRKRAWVGIGSCISNNITVTSDTMLGAGAVVIDDIDEKGTYVGVPARVME